MIGIIGKTHGVSKDTNPPPMAIRIAWSKFEAGLLPLEVLSLVSPSGEGVEVLLPAGTGITIGAIDLLR